MKSNKVEPVIITCPNCKCGKKFKRFIADHRTGVCPACGDVHYPNVYTNEMGQFKASI